MEKYNFGTYQVENFILGINGYMTAFDEHTCGMNNNL